MRGRNPATTGNKSTAARAIRAEVTAAGLQPATIMALANGPEPANNTHDNSPHPVA